MSTELSKSGDKGNGESIIRFVFLLPVIILGLTILADAIRAIIKKIFDPNAKKLRAAQDILSDLQNLARTENDERNLAPLIRQVEHLVTNELPEILLAKDKVENLIKKCQQKLLLEMKKGQTGRSDEYEEKIKKIIKNLQN